MIYPVCIFCEARPVFYVANLAECGETTKRIRFQLVADAVCSKIVVEIVSLNIKVFE